MVLAPKLRLLSRIVGGEQPDAIVAWFFVGEAEGHEFLYPKREKQELAHSTRMTLVTGD